MNRKKSLQIVLMLLLFLCAPGFRNRSEAPREIPCFRDLPAASSLRAGWSVKQKRVWSRSSRAAECGAGPGQHTGGCWCRGVI